MSRSVRVKLTYDGPTSAPPQVIVKFASEHPGSLALATALNMYELEVGFYRDIAPLTEMRIPQCHLADFDPISKAFTLVLEDLSLHSRAGDVLTPENLDVVSDILAELVGLQAPLWNSTVLRKFPWITPQATTASMLDQMAQGLPGFLERFGHGLSDDHLELFERVLPRVGDWARSWKEPLVVQHGDFRLDNFAFGTSDDAPPVTVFDFQTIRIGPPGVDVAYLIGASLSVEDRRASDRDLLTGYHQRLLASGVEGFSFDDCWRSYREGTLYGVTMFVGAACQFEPSERGDRVILDQIRRYADMAVELDAAAAVNLA
jgi:aminoglycoside/choline kinase family phosphotransferase